MSGGRDLSTSKRIVVKIGSALLVHDDGRLRAQWLDALAQEGGYELLEAFASDAAMLLLDSWPSIETVRLEVRKSGAVDAAKYSFCRLERRRG